MPRVPRVERQNAVGGMPNIRVSDDAPIEAFGGGQAMLSVGKAFGELAKTGQKIYDDAVDRADKSDEFSRVKRLSEAQNKIENDILQMRGRDSAGAYDYAQKEFDKVLDEVSDGANNRVRESLQKVGFLRREQVLKKANTHSFQELNKYEDQENKAFQEAVRQEVYSNAGDEERLAASIAQQEIAIDAHAQKYGIPPESNQVKLMKQDAVSKTHLTAINGLLDTGQFDLAAQYYEKHKDALFNPEDAKRAQSLVESGTLAARSTREADRIFASTTSLTQAIAETRNIEDPKLRDETTRRVKDLFSLKKQGEEEAKERNLVNAYNILDQTPDVNKIPRGLWTSLSGSERTALQNYASNKLSNKKVEPNSLHYSDMLRLLSNPSTRDRITNTDLYSLKDKVTNEEFKELLKLHIGSKDGSAKSELAGLETVDQVVTRTMANARIKPDSDKGRMFFNKANALAVQFQMQNGRRPNIQEVQTMMDSLLLEGVTQKGWIWDTKKKTFELGEGETFEEVEVNNIPKAERAKIEDYLRRNKKPITEANIMKLFTLKFRGQ